MSVDLNMNTVSLHATIETGRGLVQTGNYILNQDIKSSVFDSDCNQGAFLQFEPLMKLMTENTKEPKWYLTWFAHKTA